MNDTSRFPAGVEVRTFDASRDADHFLAVNNAAFSGHPEQGGWTRDTLVERLTAAWFDASLFLLADAADGLAGFNWLKIHDHDPDRPGEIYVIGVAPAHQGEGLGR